MVLLLIFLGAGCEEKNKDYATIINKQNEELENLRKKIDEIQNKQENEIPTSTENIEIEKEPLTISTPKQVDKTPLETQVPITTIKQESPSKNINESNEELKIINSSAVPEVNSINFSWKTNKPSKGKITIWPINTATGNLTLNSNSLKEVHSVLMGDYLTSEKEYHYIINAYTETGETYTSEEKIVTTPKDVQGPQIKFTSAGKATSINAFTNEPTILEIEWYIDSKSRTQVGSYLLETGGKTYTLNLKYDGKGTSDESVMYINGYATDDDGNRSFTGWKEFPVTGL